MSFIAADGDGKAVYHFAVALTLMYVVLYFFTLLLMGYIARKDDSGIRKIPKGGKGSVGIWLGWKNAEYLLVSRPLLLPKKADRAF